MKIARHHDMIVNGRPFYSWYEGKDGTHTPLPLDASAVPDAVVEAAIEAYDWDYKAFGMKRQAMRAAIAALAQALGEEG
jgi:hypothetical protein